MSLSPAIFCCCSAFFFFGLGIHTRMISITTTTIAAMSTPAITRPASNIGGTSPPSTGAFPNVGDDVTITTSDVIVVGAVRVKVVGEISVVMSLVVVEGLLGGCCAGVRCLVASVTATSETVRVGGRPSWKMGS